MFSEGLPQRPRRLQRDHLALYERDGWNHLYLYDGRTGKVKHQITKGEWVVREVVEVDEEKRQITFEASDASRASTRITFTITV